MPAGEARIVFNALPNFGRDKPLQLKYFLEAGWGGKLGKKKQELFNLVRGQPGFYILKMPACVKKYKLGIANAAPEGTRSTGGSSLGLLNRFRDYVNKFGNAKVLLMVTTVAHPDRAGARGRNTTVSNFERRIKQALNPGYRGNNIPEWYSVNSDFIENVVRLLRDEGPEQFETQQEEDLFEPAPAPAAASASSTAAPAAPAARAPAARAAARAAATPVPARAPARRQADASAATTVASAVTTRRMASRNAGPSRTSARQAARRGAATGKQPSRG